MGVLGNLVPGLRELRAPLAAGSILLLAMWIALDPTVPSRARAGTGFWKSLFDLSHLIGPVATGAAAGFATYLLGSACQVVVSDAGSIMARRKRRRFQRWRAAIDSSPADVGLELVQLDAERERMT